MKNRVHYSIDNDGIVTWISKNITELTGWEQQEVIGQQFYRFIIQKHHAGIDKKREGRQPGTIDEYETMIIIKGDGLIPVKIVVLQQENESVGTIDRRLVERHE